jgi:XRE family aerobic/anaerobic benzoate catabolism transcriptional regulator
MSSAVWDEVKDPYLVTVGENIRKLRSRRGLTRKALAELANVSERHLASVEVGTANATIIFLRQLTQVLGCSLAEVIGDETATSPEWLMIREILQGKSDAELTQARIALAETFALMGKPSARQQRVALIGMRGAGKSSLGRMLADYWMVPFVELRQQIELLAGCEVAEIHALYGMNAYLRYESRALEAIVNRYPKAVIATPGEIYNASDTFDFLLTNCFTVWLQASPRDHLNRVLVQSDGRQLADVNEAIADLESVLDQRSTHYSKADTVFDTSDMAQEAAFFELLEHLRERVQIA